MRQKSDEEIIKLCQMGDEEAFNELYKRFYKTTYYLAMQISNCDADAIDATQETFIEVHKSIKNLREIKFFRLWLKRIVVSKLNKIFAKNKVSLYDEDDVIWKRQAETRAYMIPHEQEHFKTDQDLIHRFVDNLNPRYRTIVVLTYFEELNNKEVAMICGIPEGTVKSRLSQAKKILKEQIENYENKEGTTISFRSLNIDMLFIQYFLSNAEGFTLPATLGTGTLKAAVAPTMKSSFMMSSVAAKAGVAALAVVTAVGGAYVVGEYINESFSAKSVVAGNAFNPVQLGDGTISTAEQAYDTLKQWAHCQYDLEGKTKEEIAQIKPIYDALKESKCAYYDLLVQEQWSSKFEEIAK